MNVGGTKEIVLTLRFGVPPGTDPAQAAAQLRGALHIPLGLVEWIREANAEIRDALDTPNKLL